MARRTRDALDQIDGDLGAGVARADDEDVAAPVGRRVLVARRVHELAAEAVATGPVGQERRVVVAGGDHDAFRVDHARRAVDGGCQAPAAAGAGQTVDGDAEADAQLVVGGVLLEVAHDVVAGDPGAVLARDGETGQRREDPRRVQVQAVVVTAPAGADRRGAVDDEGVDAGHPERCCGGEAGGARADDDDRFHGRRR
jgi:hypothetical protein